MDAGKLDRHVTFLRAQMIDDGLQTRPGPFAPIGEAVWASKTPVSDGERFRADTVMQDMTDRFVVRWSSFTTSIRGSDRLECEGVIYGIGGRKEIGRRDFIEITATSVAE